MTTSAPTYMYIIGNNIDIFRGVSFHREDNLIAEGLLYGNWVPLVEKNLMLNGKPLRLDWYQRRHLRDPRPAKYTEKSRRIGYTTVDVLKKTMKSQFVPIPLHMVSLTQKQTEDNMRLHNEFYDQLPNRIRAKRISDRINEKHYLLLGTRAGSSTQSSLHAHASSTISFRGLAGDITFDEFPFYKPNVASQMLKAATPLLGTTYTFYDDTQRHYEINIVGTHFGDQTLFYEITQQSHEYGKRASGIRLPWTVCPRVAQNIHNIVSTMDYMEFLEEMCCIPLSDKFSPFPPQLYISLTEDMEFDQLGIVVERDANDRIKPFDRSKYDFISVAWDYASFKAETAGFGFGVRAGGNQIEPVFYYRMRPEQFGGAIEESEIVRIMDETSRILRPDYLGYDATGVGQYLSKTLFDPAFGFKEDRRPRLSVYPYAESAEPVEITSDYKNAAVSKLKIAMENRILSKIPMCDELLKQLRNFRRSITAGGKVKYAAEGKGKNPRSLDDIVMAMLLAISPLHIDVKPRAVPTAEFGFEEIQLVDQIAGTDQIFTLN